MLTLLRRLVLTAAAGLVALPLWGFDTRATSAWVYDMTTLTVLMDKNGETPVPPASMSKLMTINMLFEALRDGRVTMDTTFGVSARAVEMTARGGSTMYLQGDDRPTVEELIHGIIINSGNDACIVVAEGLSGTEEAFAAQMTARAAGSGIGAIDLCQCQRLAGPQPAHVDARSGAVVTPPDRRISRILPDLWHDGIQL